MPTTEKATCKVPVDRGDNRWSDWGDCGRPVEEGKPKCNFHLSVDRRATARAEQRKVRDDTSANNKARSEEICGRLRAFGIESAPNYSQARLMYTSAIIVTNPDKLADLLDNVAEFYDRVTANEEHGS